MNAPDWRCTEQTPTTRPRYRCDLPAGHHGDHFRVGFGAWFTPNPEVAAALRMYRKVQRLQACDDIFGFGVKMDTFLHFQYAAPLLAWLKEGEA